jgi:hypothetical protein
MAQKLAASMPDTLDLPAFWTVRFAALDPSTGATVSGVTVSGASMIVGNKAGGNLASPGFEVVDIEWLNVPIDDTSAA